GAGGEGLDADHRSGRYQGQRQLAFDRATAGLCHAYDDLRLDRTRYVRLFVKRHGKACLAVVVGVRQFFEWLAGGRHILAVGPELITGKAGPLARWRNDDLAFELELGGRRAVEKTPVHRHLGRAGLGKAARLRAELEFDPVGHVVLDHEGRLAERRALRIAEGANAPRPARGG